MVANDLIHRLAEDMLPLPAEQFFTAARAPDMWFGDQLPPTYQDYLDSPQVQQAKWLARYQMSVAAERFERRVTEQQHRDRLVRQGRRKRR